MLELIYFSSPSSTLTLLRAAGSVAILPLHVTYSLMFEVFNPGASAFFLSWLH